MRLRSHHPRSSQLSNPSRMDFTKFLAAQDEAMGLLGETINKIIQDIKEKKIVPLWKSQQVFLAQYFEIVQLLDS
jgi:hypothetical protein